MNMMRYFGNENVPQFYRFAMSVHIQRSMHRTAKILKQWNSCRYKKSSNECSHPKNTTSKFMLKSIYYSLFVHMFIIIITYCHCCITLKRLSIEIQWGKLLISFKWVWFFVKCSYLLKTYRIRNENPLEPIHSMT